MVKQASAAQKALTAGDRPLVSVIVRTCNDRNGSLQEALDSVVAQTWRPLELVVVEDGSEHAKVLVESIPCSQGLSVRYRSLPKVGRCVAGNAGLEISTGKYCGFLDDDDAFFPEHVEKLTTAMEAMPLHVAAYAAALEVKSEISSYSPFLKRDQKPEKVFRNFQREALWVGNFLPIQAVLFKRSLFLENGGFDPELNNLEDWDLWSRYAASGEFVGLDVVSSLFRVPAKESERQQRNAKLDAFYPLARKKQNGITLQLSPNAEQEVLLGILRQYRIFSFLEKLRLLNLRSAVAGRLRGTRDRQADCYSVGELIRSANYIATETPALKRCLWLSTQLKRLVKK